MTKIGKLYLIPTDLGHSDYQSVIPNKVLDITRNLKHFIVEREKTSRAFLKGIESNISQNDLEIFELSKHKKIDAFAMLSPCFQGFDMGIISEAGCPGVADPGSILVLKAHELDIVVEPLVGPSSILLAIMAAGLNGQSFSFHGYLPIQDKDRNKKIKQFENISSAQKQTQIFIETPYRNVALFEALQKVLMPSTKLSVAINITHPNAYIKTLSVSEWKGMKLKQLHKNPCVFSFLA